MSTGPVAPDGGDDDRGDLWDRAGRRAVGMMLDDAGFDVASAVEEITVETMYHGNDPTPEQIREARMALNTARRILEDHVAPAAGCEPWGGPVPDYPYSRLREIAHCPGADDDQEDADE